MRNKDSTKRTQRKTARDAHVQMMLMVFVLAMLAFACGYYFAMAEIASMLTN